jgi:hypothetical protein
MSRFLSEERWGRASQRPFNAERVNIDTLLRVKWVNEEILFGCCTKV